ncbi:DUF4192 family protein [Nonomuraea angiospora]|uniref:DUF4192 family protein n=1 Tax=Nonomuraea angiospora TaxID=46172 RepID=UPI0029ADF239|nr:DUF4192 family protein [Nonomuraea angiospora]MDX3100492.1 DUF4192 family protein [Nonomuraea angiospora]
MSRSSTTASTTSSPSRSAAGTRSRAASSDLPPDPRGVRPGAPSHALKEAQHMTAATRAVITAAVDAAVRAATDHIDNYVKRALRLLDSFHAGELAAPDELPLVLALHITRIRDMALQGINPANATDRADAWTNLAMRTEPVFIAPVATLAACAAFVAGDAEHGTDALETAIIVDPGYQLAHLMRAMLRNGAVHADFDVSDVPLPDVQPRPTWAVPLLGRADLYHKTTVSGVTADAGHGKVNARAAVARAARGSGLAVRFASAESAHYEQNGKALTITYDSDGGLVEAFYIRSPSQPGKPLDSLADVIGAVSEIASGPTNTLPT